MQHRQFSMDYQKRKEAGTVRLARQGNAHVLLLRKFDPETGAEVAAEQEAVDISVLQAQRAQMSGQLAALDELIADLQATTVTLGELLNGAARG